MNYSEGFRSESDAFSSLFLSVGCEGDASRKYLQTTAAEYSADNPIHARVMAAYALVLANKQNFDLAAKIFDTILDDDLSQPEKIETHLDYYAVARICGRLHTAVTEVDTARDLLANNTGQEYKDTQIKLDYILWSIHGNTEA